jgi:hypothetical protein
MNNKFYDHIDHLHLEPTSACSASCPSCARNWMGSHITPSEMHSGEFDPAWVNRFKNLNFIKCTINGNYGDLMNHADPIGLLTAIKNQWPRISIQINTHGSGLDAEAWKQIGLLGWIGKGCETVHAHFGIDGTDNVTHAKYRRGTDLDLILANAAAFIEGGGVATWVMTEFEHNKHQVDEARYLSETMGFDQFILRPSTRHMDRMPSPVVQVDGDKATVVDWIGPAKDSNPDFAKAEKSIRRGIKTMHAKGQYQVGRQDSETQFATVVDCWAKRENSIYVDAQGFLYPCGWLGKPILWQNVGINLKTSFSFNNTSESNPIHILQHEFWELLHKSTKGNSLSPCQRSCGADSKSTEIDSNSIVQNFKALAGTE